MSQAKADAKTIFLEALERQEGRERLRFLDEACGGDAVLRARVEELLLAHQEAGSFLEPGGSSPVATVDASPVAAVPSTLIGPYKLLEQIGEGGFGVVFLAEQLAPVRRKVALKVLKPGMDSKQIIARFEAERQALALMDHPNIAKVFDGGATPEGRLYFVMELVKGLPITDFCDQNHLNPRQRLELFLSVCQAVQHAHQKGIIHRDLKPSNVLVSRHDTTPVVKVIDFGVAKAIGQELTDKSLFTGIAQMVGTPLYMSPEQAGMSDLDVDTRSDIYSLGVLLYELLTGTTPFTRDRFKKAAYDEIRRIIREEEPPRPSNRLSESKDRLPSISAQRQTPPAQLTRLVRGELDWIVMKALEKDRTRRYETANGFAMDVQRYLADEPVLAGPPSAGYRLRKFARRHQTALVTAMLVGALLAGGAVVATTFIWQAKQLAEVNYHDALDQKTLVEEKARELARNLYLHRIALAHAELLGQNIGRAEQLLEECPPELRSWEWHHLKRLGQGEQRAYRVFPNEYWQTALLSADGRRLVTSIANPKGKPQTDAVVVWDATTGKEILRLPLPASERSLTLSPDGKYLAISDQEKSWRVVDVATRDVVVRCQDDSPVYLGAFSPDGARLVSWNATGTLTLWDVTTGQRIRHLRGHTKGVQCVVYSPDGKWVASAGTGDEAVRLWNVENGEQVHQLAHPGWVWSVAFSPDSRRLASGCYDGSAKVWDVATGKEVLTFYGHTLAVFSVAFSPDGRRVASGGWDRTIKLWDSETGQEALTLRGHEDGVGMLVFSRDGLLASASSGGKTMVWDGTPLRRDNPEVRTIQRHTRVVSSVAVSPDGRRLASASWDGSVHLWDAMTGSVVLRLRGHTRMVREVAFHPGGSYLASCGWDSIVRIWNTQTGEEIHTFPQGHLVNGLAFSPDGQHLAVIGHHLFAIWDWKKERKVVSLDPAPIFWHVRFSPDGRRLATADHNNTVTIWDARTGNVLLGLTGHRSRVYDVAFSRDGLRLVSGSIDKTVKWWDLKTKTELGPLPDQRPERVVAVAYSPDDRHVAAGYADGVLMVWDTTTRQVVHTLRGHAGYVWSVQFAEGGASVISSSGHASRGEVKIWDLKARDKR